jgi:hypothetical protein
MSFFGFTGNPIKSRHVRYMRYMRYLRYKRCNTYIRYITSMSYRLNASCLIQTNRLTSYKTYKTGITEIMICLCVYTATIRSSRETPSPSRSNMLLCEHPHRDRLQPCTQRHTYPHPHPQV